MIFQIDRKQKILPYCLFYPNNTIKFQKNRESNDICLTISPITSDAIIINSLIKQKIVLEQWEDDICHNKYALFSNCYNLTGSPICGNNVTDMYSTYSNCPNLTGSPVCGPNVVNMAYTYGYCPNLTGSPVCGDTVTNMYYPYDGCKNLYGNMYMFSDYVSNVYYCFNTRNNNNMLNIYVNKNSISYSFLAGKSVTFTNAGSYLYNTRDNIYIYPVKNVQEAYEVSTAPIVNISELVDFTVVSINNNYVLSDWKQTTNGVTGTEVIIPYTPNFNIIY